MHHCTCGQYWRTTGRAAEDRLDAQWIARLAEMGLLRPSFVPPPEIRALPVSLHWSGDEVAARFDLDDAKQQLLLYVTVLREAGEPTDLGDWLDGGQLVELWPRLAKRLPKTVRAAWEEQHSVLRDAGAGQGLRAAS